MRWRLAGPNRSVRLCRPAHRPVRRRGRPTRPTGRFARARGLPACGLGSRGSPPVATPLSTQHSLTSQIVPVLYSYHCTYTVLVPAAYRYPEGPGCF